MKIISLLPSATEIVAALGRERDLVGRSGECDYPESVRSLPAVMIPNSLDGEAPSAAIDDRVRASRGADASLYRIDLPLLRALRPDVILTQDLCRVCSVTEEEVARACGEAGIDPRIVTLEPTTLREVWSSVETIGEAIGARERASELADELRSRVARTARLPREGARVAVVEWLDPPILAGLWVEGMVTAAGGVYLGPVQGGRARSVSWSEIDALQPELMVLSPCSFSVDRTHREIARSSVGDELSRLSSVEAIWLADEAYFSRPGPRLADGVELLRHLLSGTEPPAPMPLERWKGARAERAS